MPVQQVFCVCESAVHERVGTSKDDGRRPPPISSHHPSIRPSTNINIHPHPFPSGTTPTTRPRTSRTSNARSKSSHASSPRWRRFDWMVRVFWGFGGKELGSGWWVSGVGWGVWGWAEEDEAARKKKGSDKLLGWYFDVMARASSLWVSFSFGLSLLPSTFAPDYCVPSLDRLLLTYSLSPRPTTNSTPVVPPLT